MVSQVHLPELQLNKANATYTETPFLDLHLSIANGFAVYIDNPYFEGMVNHLST